MRNIGNFNFRPPAQTPRRLYERRIAALREKNTRKKQITTQVGVNESISLPVTLHFVPFHFVPSHFDPVTLSPGHFVPGHFVP
jgi:hypothetical protein